MDAHISRQLSRVMRRQRRARRLRSLSWLWSVLALSASILIGIAPLPLSGETIAQTLLAIGVCGTLWSLRPRARSAQETLAAARAVEARFPELQQRLLTAIEQVPDAESGHFSWLQNMLASEVRSHAYVYDWRKSRPLPELLLRGATALTALGLTLWLSARLWTIEATGPAGLPPHENAERSDTAHPFQVSVDPGDAEVERGSSLLILARFDGPLPADVSLLRSTPRGGADAPRESSLPMAKALDDPLFGIRLPSVTSDFEYRVQYDTSQSERFRVSVYERPRVERIDATIEFPAYANLPDETVEDTWQVAAVEGSTVVLTCRLNKPIASGRLLSERGEEFPLTALPDAQQTASTPITASSSAASSPAAASPADASPAAGSSVASSPGDSRYAVRIPVQRSLKLRFVLHDDRGRSNRDGDEFRISALPNRPPEITLTFPARDLRVSPVEELQLEASVWDDFGLTRAGLQLTVADQPPGTITLTGPAAGRETHQLAHLIQLELRNARPDQLVSYFFFAEDVDAAGQTRRTMSDMFFAEVRHFEEIFREGRQPPGGQSQQAGQNAQQAEQLAELQKQIISATWKIIRRETRDQVTADFVTDTGLLVESQQEALTRLQKLAEQLRDPVSKGHAANVARAMTSAVDRLTTARTQKNAGVLTEALQHERSACQGLLKLRAREHKVTRQNSQSSPGQRSGQQRSQQIDQLELDNRKNRYETGRKARPPQQQQEQLQVLNRLRELARRQSDLNQKLRELELALKTAQDRQEQEEIQRRLKRLRDEQRELLRDFDELRNRMRTPENQQQLAGESRRLDQTRQRVQQASEALERGQVSRALNSGTRAARELEQLRDDVRQKAAGQFGDAMRELRQQARDIDRRQDFIAQKLQGHSPQTSSDRPSLRTTQKRDDLRDEFRDQRKQLDQVMERMREIVEKAETAEPLLARQLYETVRQTRSDQTAEALQQADLLLQRGLMKEAGQAEEHARQGIARMRRGIDRAAESVLGNELETLRRASRELTDARDAIARELAQNGHQPKAQRQQSDSAGQQPGQPEQTPDRPGQKPDSAGTEPESSGPAATADGAQQKTARRPAAAARSEQSGSRNPAQTGQSSGQQPNQQGQPGQAEQPGQPSGAQRNRQPKPGSEQPSEGSNRRQPPGLRNAQRAAGQQQSQPGQQQTGRGGLQMDGAAHHSQGAPPVAPLTGRDFVPWSDQLRTIEELIDDPKLRADVARIREAARSMRIDFKRHSRTPEWSLVRAQILEPLNELRQQLREEIARRESPDSLVPIDRDPVPEKYSDLVRRYYERIGAGRARSQTPQTDLQQ